MPKLPCNGFSMFANHCKAKLEAQRGRKFQAMEQLIEATNPLWRALSEEERKVWKDKAKEYKRTEEYFERRRSARWRGNKSSASAVKDKMGGESEVEEDEDCGSDDDPGVPMVRTTLIHVGDAATIHLDSNPQGHLDVSNEWNQVSGLSKAAMEEKKQRDKQKLVEFFVKESGGRLVDVKRCRFLMMSIQTYGHLEEGVCIPAEVAIVDWSLAKGIMEEFGRMVGPWEIEDETLKERALFNAQQSHRIPLEGCEGYAEFSTTRRNFLRELLGRTEPGIAFEQGVKVGLYKNGMVEDKDVRTDEYFEISEKDKTSGGGRNDAWPLLPGDNHGRRWVVCLQSEFQTIMEAIRYLRDTEQIVYDGFPVTPDRFIFIDTLLDTLAEFVHWRLDQEESTKLVKALQEPGEEEHTTPWDSMPEMYCRFHNLEQPTQFCAVAVARKACFTIFHCLKHAYDLPFQSPETE